MAKQQTMGPSSTLLSASAALAESKSSTPVLTAIGEGFGSVIQAVEKEQLAIQDRVNDYMGNLKTDIDFTTLDPAMEKEVRSYLLEGKNEYSSLANELARINDASDPRYQEITDKMSEIQRGYSNLAAELTAYNQNKITVAEQMRNGEFSKGTDPAQLAQTASVYGIDGTKPSVSIKGGHLVFGTNGETVEFRNMRNIPGVASDIINPIFEAQVKLSRTGVPMTPQEKTQFGRQIEDALRKPDALASILSDYPMDLPFEDLREKFFTARKNGSLNAETLTEIKQEVKGRLLTAFEEANDLGVKNARKEVASKSKTGKDQRTSAQKDYDAAVKRITAGFNARVPMLISKEGIRVSPSGSDDWIVEEWDPVEKVWTPSKQKQRKTLEGLIGLIPAI